ncbi:Hypothetical protein NTJ_10746 [Nesidiocoris tenuis]|uniref:Uncharacterized protein n=1 Tax=Nesidiocoris tenuis TaxID=355587 RepID=A0ABN7B0H6_9HEMI|nr:Hypothetical protein NTJ_10746 [Nesidiocoris tenuis]
MPAICAEAITKLAADEQIKIRLPLFTRRLTSVQPVGYLLSSNRTPCVPLSTSPTKRRPFVLIHQSSRYPVRRFRLWSALSRGIVRFWKSSVTS